MERDYFKQRRKALGYTQKDLAGLLNVTQSTISRYEKELSELRCKAEANCILGITERQMAFNRLRNAFIQLINQIKESILELLK